MLKIKLKTSLYLEVFQISEPSKRKHHIRPGIFCIALNRQASPKEFGYLCLEKAWERQMKKIQPPYTLVTAKGFVTEASLSIFTTRRVMDCNVGFVVNKQVERLLSSGLREIIISFWFEPTFLTGRKAGGFLKKVVIPPLLIRVTHQWIVSRKMKFIE